MLKMYMKGSKWRASQRMYFRRCIHNFKEHVKRFWWIVNNNFILNSIRDHPWPVTRWISCRLKAVHHGAAMCTRSQWPQEHLSRSWCAFDSWVCHDCMSCATSTFRHFRVVLELLAVYKRLWYTLVVSSVASYTPLVQTLFTSYKVYHTDSVRTFPLCYWRQHG
jgi:hypothetical protein